MIEVSSSESCSSKQPGVGLRYVGSSRDRRELRAGRAFSSDIESDGYEVIRRGWEVSWSDEFRSRFPRGVTQPGGL